MKLALSMIVKDEAERITRALASAVQFIDAWVICDTGSTDNTIQVIEDFFKVHRIPGHIITAPFENWSQARNAALFEAQEARLRYGHDYILLMDADMELVVKDVEKFLVDREGASYDMYQHAGATHYQNRRLAAANVVGQYRGCTHEYYDVATAGCIPEDVAFFVDHADGSNRPDKFKRDIRLLTQGLVDEPNNERYMFYLAQSYRDAGEIDKAIEWYRKRVAAGGWDEEVWQAQVYLAQCFKTKGDVGGYIAEMLVAYNMRPSRAEAMYDIAHHFRHAGNNASALAFAEAVEHLPPSRDALFVNDYTYKVGVQEEISISAFYVPGKREKGYKAASDLSLLAGPYGGARELARMNLYYYLEPLSKFCPSFRWQEIDFKAPDGYTAMNPSVTRVCGVLVCNVRCVNYRMDEEGRYLIKATDGTANASNPINTRNFIVDLNDDLGVVCDEEVLNPEPPIPCEFPLVTGFEDMRIFEWKGGLWSSSTVRQIHWDGNCEQVLTRLGRSDSNIQRTHTDLHRMLRQPRGTEKNWMPISTGFELKFMHRPGEVVDTDGNTVVKHDTGLATDHISGSSQLIAFNGGWLGVVHEARHLPGSHLRYYYHRFVWFNADFSLKKFSLPFYFNDKVIEFCAGLCPHPNGNDFVISYGYKDESARLATVSVADVEKFLCA